MTNMNFDELAQEAFATAKAHGCKLMTCHVLRYTPFYRKIKELNPEIKVAYGGTAGIPLDFIEESFRAGAAEAMDVMCIHPYRWSETPELSLATDLAALHELMERYGVGDKPVWFTEMGYSTVEPLPFLSAVLPRLFAALEMKPEATECVTFSDDEYLYYTETPGFQLKLLLPEVKSVRSITLKELKNLKAAPDTLPILSIAASAAKGDTVLGNVPQARIKETDRIRCMRENLERLGVEAEEREDALIIHGKGRIKGGKTMGYGDHRIIMSLAIASAASEEAIEIDDERAAAVTFPSFFSLLETIRR